MERPCRCRLSTRPSSRSDSATGGCGCSACSGEVEARASCGDVPPPEPGGDSLLCRRLTRLLGLRMLGRRMPPSVRTMTPSPGAWDCVRGLGLGDGGILRHRLSVWAGERPTFCREVSAESTIDTNIFSFLFFKLIYVKSAPSSTYGMVARFV